MSFSVGLSSTSQDPSVLGNVPDEARGGHFHRADSNAEVVHQRPLLGRCEVAHRGAAGVFPATQAVGPDGLRIFFTLSKLMNIILISSSKHSNRGRVSGRKPDFRLSRVQIRLSFALAAFTRGLRHCAATAVPPHQLSASVKFKCISKKA